MQIMRMLRNANNEEDVEYVISFHYTHHDAAVSPRELPGYFNQHNTWGA
jgi:hypothetical protein